MPETTKISMDKGFTFIEVLGAVVILGIVLIAYLSLSGNWVLFENKSAYERKAVQIAEKHLRDIKVDHNRCVTDSWPKTEEGGYSVQCQQVQMNSLTGGGGSQYPVEIDGPEHVSLQTVFWEGGTMYVATVTVSWGND